MHQFPLIIIVLAASWMTSYRNIKPVKVCCGHIFIHHQTGLLLTYLFSGIKTDFRKISHQIPWTLQREAVSVWCVWGWVCKLLLRAIIHQIKWNLLYIIYSMLTKNDNLSSHRTLQTGFKSIYLISEGKKGR